MQWLHDANMVYLCQNVSVPELPVKAYEKENEFKLYINDTGLLMALYGFETKKALLNGTLKGAAKVGIFENFVVEALVQNGYSLHYYKPDDNSELEFVIEKDGEVVPIEVKAGNTATKSLNRFIEEFKPENAFKLISGNIGQSDNKITLPHYLTMFI